jgi:hypothetical protein
VLGGLPPQLAGIVAQAHHQWYCVCPPAGCRDNVSTRGLAVKIIGVTENLPGSEATPPGTW